MTNSSNRNKYPFDALVIGAGVAGTAAALHLLASGQTVAVIHRADRRDAIETLSPYAVSALSKLGVSCGANLHQVVAWWRTNETSRQRCHGARIVRRLSLSETLRARALDAGATLITARGIKRLARSKERWHAEWEGLGGAVAAISARAVVDATGISCWIGRQMGTARIHSDRLFAVTWPCMAHIGTGTWTERAPHGWWNLSSIGSDATLSFFGSAKAAREACNDFDGWFQSTKRLKSLVARVHQGSVTIRACGSSRLSNCAGPGWICVGDAASALQPIASAGVAKALRDADRVVDGLRRPEEYTRLQRGEHHHYLQALREQYGIPQSASK